MMDEKYGIIHMYHMGLVDSNEDVEGLLAQ
jgi:hypothetical protein